MFSLSLLPYSSSLCLSPLISIRPSSSTLCSYHVSLYPHYLSPSRFLRTRTDLDTIVLFRILKIGAEVHGTVDGAFDSGFLVTARVNGQLFRGVLFAPATRVSSPAAGMAAPPRPSAPRLRVPEVTSDSSRRSGQLAKHCPPKGSGDLGGLVLSLGSSVGGS